MDDLNDLALFAQVVEHRGFSAASRNLGIPKSRLSRRIAMLEQQLGVRLLQRSSRVLQVTSVGQLFYDRCQAVVAMSRAARDSVQETLAEPQGTLRISCPISLAQFWLTPRLPLFMASHPKVRIALVTTNRRVDPLEDATDLVLRVRRPPFEDSQLVVRPLGKTNDVLLASPAFLEHRRPPADPQELSAWPTLSIPGPERQAWQLGNGARRVEVTHEPRLATEDMFAIKQAALEGVGVALLPEVICHEEIASGALQRVLPEWSCAPSEIQAVFASRRGMLPAVRACIDFLVANPPGQPWRPVGASVPRAA